MSICSVMVVVTRQGKLGNVGGKWDFEEKIELHDLGLCTALNYIN